jgi:hypothetical protein
MKGVGSAFQPRAVSSNHAMMSSGEVGSWLSSARWTMMRWTDSVMFSHEPLSGVYTGNWEWLRTFVKHRVNDAGLLCLLNKMAQSRRDGKRTVT